jgi:hypothetical protein
MFQAKHFWIVLSRLFGYSALAVWLGHFYFWYSYFDSSPRQPDASTGHVIPLNNRGNVHYLTSLQDGHLTTMEVAAFALFARGFLINEFIVRPANPKPWEKRQF